MKTVYNLVKALGFRDGDNPTVEDIRWRVDQLNAIARAASDVGGTTTYEIDEGRMIVDGESIPLPEAIVVRKYAGPLM